MDRENLGNRFSCVGVFPSSDKSRGFDTGHEPICFDEEVVHHEVGVDEWGEEGAEMVPSCAGFEARGVAFAGEVLGWVEIVFVRC